jgi:hypothetical protein
VEEGEEKPRTASGRAINESRHMAIQAYLVDSQLYPETTFAFWPSNKITAVL